MEDQFRAWWQESYGLPPGPHAVMTHVAWGEHLLATRPKPPSLKKQALGALSRADKDALTNPLTGEVVALWTILNKEQSDTIRRALEALPND